MTNLIGTPSQIAKAEKMIYERKAEIEKAISKGKSSKYKEDIEQMEVIDNMSEIDAGKLVHNFYSSLIRQGITTWNELFKA